MYHEPQQDVPKYKSNVSKNTCTSKLTFKSTNKHYEKINTLTIEILNQTTHKLFVKQDLEKPDTANGVARRR